MTYKLKTYTLRNYKTIPQIENLSDEMIEAIEVVGRVLPFKTNNYVTEELIDWTRIDSDPMFTLTFPRREMLEKKHYNTIKRLLDQGADKATLDKKVHEIRMKLNPNPAGQEHNVPEMNNIKLKGVQHKYAETVLFFPSQGQTCHAYCSFCFRWPQFSGMSNLRFAMNEINLLSQYLLRNNKVTDVLFTGGDPMTMNTRILSTYINALLEPELKNIHTIRIGTKALSYWPYRFTKDKDSEELLKLFERVVKKGKNLAIQAHFSHPTELKTFAVQEAIKKIRTTGAQIRTQSPLLKNINDKPEIWAEMWRKQVDLGCIPYYMFVARDTGSKRYFELPLDKCWNVFRKAYRQVSGVCRTVRGPSMSCEPGKIQVLGVQEVKGEKVYVLRFLQGRDANWVNIPFFAKYDPKATWFDQLEPAFGEEKFFFEKGNEKTKVREFMLE
ncbi:MAG TPA: lysine 2,3-aminomutase [Bacteroidetes bacterium]|nr:lysine 2,3-aminomutase [Bacteroidota bacterium]